MLARLPNEQKPCSLGIGKRGAAPCRGEEDVEDKYAVFISAVRTARPATGPARSFFKFRAYALNVQPSGFRLLDVQEINRLERRYRLLIDDRS